MLNPIRSLAFLLPFCATVMQAVEADKGDTPSGPDKGEADFLASLKVPEGMKPAVWAKDQQILNAIAIDIDEQGRVYTSETFRWRKGGVIDVRNFMFLYKDDLQVRTSADRAAMIEKWKDKFPKDFFTKESERIRVIEDKDGDGKADSVTVFADGFRDTVDGPAAGILVQNGRVYFTNIPKIWAFDDKDGDLKADNREVLSDGWGPRFSISGHDLHGLAMGPDGRIYVSLGDRGYNVTSKEGVNFTNPMSGGVFRFDPDGSNLEQYYLGLRNPQELAFDAYGNLFTVDNNADIGDAARVVYILEGGSSAWNHGWQLLGNDGFAKGAGLDGRQPNPWLEEGLWKSPFPEQPAWVLPAVGHITSGPSGVAFYPGVGFGDRLKDHFLVCDYRAGADSGVWSFKLNEKGAGYELPDEQKQKFCWGLPPTDVVFGYDGRAYISDYIGGWELNNHGRVVTVSDPATRDSADVKALKALMAAGFTKRPVAELASLLGHADQRVRQHAQFELVGRAADGRAALATAAASGASTLARLHGVWGLWQLARKDASVAARIGALLGDGDARVREQAARILGDLRHAASAPALVKLLGDADARVRSLAAIALGRLKHQAAVPELLRMLKDNADQDVYLRHAAVMGLIGCSEPKALAALATDASAGVRMGALLALRRLADNGCAAFLDDAAPLVRAEAIRAVYEVPLPTAMPQLIAQLAKPLDKSIPEPIARLLYLRLINAAQRWGDEGAAKALVDFAAAQKAPVDVRAAALKALENWEKPTWIDPVIGYPRKPLRREKGPNPAPLKAGIMAVVDHGEERLLASAVRLAQRFGYGLDDQVLLTILDNAGMAADVRSEALVLLTERKNPTLGSRLPNLLKEENAAIRRAAFSALVASDRKAAIAAGIAALNQEGSSQPEFIAIPERSDGPWSALPMGEPGVDNLARKGTVTWVDSFSVPFKDAGAEGAKLPRLNDGKLAENDDDTKASVWFEQHEARFVLDLGSAVELGRVDTWSWHKANRSQQEFTLWAASGERMPDATVVNPSTGWVKLADASTVKLGEGGKQAVSVLNTTGSLGTYRWLMWQSKRKGTFFSEVAAYAHGKVPTGLVRVVTDKEGEWGALSMGAPDAAGLAVSGAVATTVEGFAKPAADAGAEGGRLPRLFSRELPENKDDPKRNTWTEDGEGRWLVDLQKPVELARINTYSWHHHERAVQGFTLWGAAGDQAPDAKAKDPGAAGWRRIAAVDTKALGDGGKHASSVLALGRSLGTYRWLLWQHAERKGTTFVSRIDVFPVGVELPPIKRPLSPASIALKQQVLTSFGALDDAESAKVIGDWLERLAAGKAQGEVHLELVTAAAARKEPAIAAKLKAWRDRIDPKDPLAPHRVALRGGDEENGKQIFKFHISQCIKCHSVNQEGGNAGPDLAGVGKRLSPEKLLESLIAPSAVVVPGFGLATVSLKDGTSVAGSLLKQDDKGAVVKLADSSEVTILKDKIDKVTPPVSPMPPLGVVLSPAELRDVMAYLGSLK
jgi:putative membrane-bound dehydrogenase-like protein